MSSAVKKPGRELTKKVLFQKLGNTWFIFTQVDNQMVYSMMPEGMDPKTTDLHLYEIIEEHMDNVSKKGKKSNGAELR